MILKELKNAFELEAIPKKQIYELIMPEISGLLNKEDSFSFKHELNSYFSWINYYSWCNCRPHSQI